MATRDKFPVSHYRVQLRLGSNTSKTAQQANASYKIYQHYSEKSSINSSRLQIYQNQHKMLQTLTDISLYATYKPKQLRSIVQRWKSLQHALYKESPQAILSCPYTTLVQLWRALALWWGSLPTRVRTQISAAEAIHISCIKTEQTSIIIICTAL